MSGAPGETAASALSGADDDSEARSRAEKLVGTVIAERYRIHNVLAMGGMGAVFTGEHVHMRKRVAIKVLHPDTEGLPGLVARFEREAIVGAHVEHKNIAAARDFGRMEDGSYYLVLEFVRGLTLRQILRQGRLPVRRAVEIARQIATGLSKVHHKGIIHRDLNPRNVMVIPGKKDQVKLIDFGFAKVPVEKFSALSVQQGVPMAPSQITGDGVIFGTIGFLAPEAALGMKMVDKRSDLYALGAILYEMLSTEPPFDGPNPAAHYLKHRIEPVPPMKERAPGVEVPEALEAIAMKLLAKEPGDRFQRVDEVVKALDEAAAALSGDDIVVDFEEVAPSELTVAGADGPTSLPRFEDVAERAGGKRSSELTSGTHSTSGQRIDLDAPGASAAHAEREPRKTSWAVWVLALVVLGGAGAFAFTKLRPAGPSAPAATPSTPAASAAPSAPGAPAASVSAAPTATAKPQPTVTQVDGLDADAWRQIVRQAPLSKDYAKAVQGLMALAELDSSALASPDMKTAAADVVVNAGLGQSSKLVRVMSEKFESDGLDVLYDIATRRGGTEAASMALELLKKPDVVARGSAAFRLALELRQAPCSDKLKLLERAVKEGDSRALAILVALRDPECDVTNGACCFPNNADVEKAVIDLTNRTERH